MGYDWDGARKLVEKQKELQSKASELIDEAYMDGKMAIFDGFEELGVHASIVGGIIIIYPVEGVEIMIDLNSDDDHIKQITLKRSE